METKITLGKIASAIQVLEQIKNKKPSFKIDYWVMRNIKLLTDSYNFFIQKREEIFKKYCILEKNQCGQDLYYHVDEHGNIQFNLKKDADVKAFNHDFSDLMNMETEDIVPFKLSIDAINDSANFNLDNEEDIFSIDFLLSE